MSWKKVVCLVRILMMIFSEVLMINFVVVCDIEMVRLFVSMLVLYILIVVFYVLCGFGNMVVGISFNLDISV